MWQARLEDGVVKKDFYHRTWNVRVERGNDRKGKHLGWRAVTTLTGGDGGGKKKRRKPGRSQERNL